MASVLVVDDSEDMQELYELVLDAAGHVVEHAFDGHEALHAIAQASPDVVLLDMMMPGMDGLEVLEQLRRRGLSGRPAVIACSGFEGYRDEAIARGAVAFLRKPTEPDVLLQAIESATAGTAVPQHVIERNAQTTADLRQVATLAAAEVIARLDQRGLAGVHPWMNGLAMWLGRYYGFGAVLVNLWRGKSMQIEATYGELPFLAEGLRVGRSQTYCDDVLDAGSTLVMNDPLHHPARHFSEHGGVRLSGFHFYAGAPMTTSKGVVLGTLCIIGREVHHLYAEDMRLIGRLAREIARELDTYADGKPAAPPIDVRGIWGPTMLSFILEATLERCRRLGGRVELARLELDDDAMSRVSGVVNLVTGGRGTALFRSAPKTLLLVVGQSDAALAHNAMQAALDAARSVAGPMPIRTALWTPSIGDDAKTGPELVDMLLEKLERSS